MIINTGQRTDIPAFYSKWLMNRIKQGYVLVRNPYYPKLVTRYLLNPKVVDVMGFCTKNPRPLLPYLDKIKPFHPIFHVSITIFERDIEPNVPKKQDVIEDFRQLSRTFGKNAMCLRYTPIIINEKYTLERHLRAFEYITSELEGYTSLVIFGFLDLYPHIETMHPEFHDCSDSDKIKIAQSFLEIAKKHGMELRLCSKEKWLKDYGIDVDGCLRLEDYEKASGLVLKPKKKMEARKSYCSCLLSNDIGAYQSCPHFCQYCYANREKSEIIENCRLHDDDSPLLIGNLKKDDIIKDAIQESWIDTRLELPI